MQDEITWKLSLLVDDELPPDEAIFLLEQINQDPDLRDKWYQYQAIRHAIRNNGESLYLQADFLERIQGVLENEPMPQHEVAEQTLNPPNRFNLNTWIAIPLALTAMVVVVLLLQRQTPESESLKTLPLVAAVQSPQPSVLKVSSNSTAKNPVHVPASLSESSSLEDFLLVHSEDSLYQQGPQHMLSYARIISHDHH